MSEDYEAISSAEKAARTIYDGETGKWLHQMTKDELLIALVKSARRELRKDMLQTS